MSNQRSARVHWRGLKFSRKISTLLHQGRRVTFSRFCSSSIFLPSHTSLHSSNEFTGKLPRSQNNSQSCIARSVQAEDLKTKANAAFSAGKNDEAISLYSKAIELDGNNHVLFSNRSAAYAKSDKYEEALQDAEKCIALKPDFVKVRLDRWSLIECDSFLSLRVTLEKVQHCRSSSVMTMPLPSTRKVLKLTPTISRY